MASDPILIGGAERAFLPTIERARIAWHLISCVKPIRAAALAILEREGNLQVIARRVGMNLIYVERFREELMTITMLRRRQVCTTEVFTTNMVALEMYRAIMELNGRAHPFKESDFSHFALRADVPIEELEQFYKELLHEAQHEECLA